MRIATRLVLTLTLVVAVVMWIYALISLRQREDLISDALIREAEIQGGTLQIVLDNALRDRRFNDIDRVLMRVGADPETFLSVVLDAEGEVLVGGPASAVSCLASQDPQIVESTREAQGWANCGGRVRWISLPLREPGSTMILGRRARVVDRDMAATRWRVLLTTFALVATAGVSILLVLRRTLSTPLAGIMKGVASLGGPNPPLRVETPRAAGELHDLAVAFNEMADRLEGKSQSLIRETEERVALERQLRHSEKFAALGRFTGGLAHEIGTPLNVIAVRAEAVAGDPGVPSTARRHAEEIIGEIDRIAHLVSGLSHIARRHDLVQEAVDVVAVAEAVVADLHSVASEASVRITLDAPGNPVTTRGDRTLLQHALNNLVLNSIQALESHPDEREVRIEVAHAGSEARVTVVDSGPGIAPEHLPHLFEPFFTTRDVGEGTGLGLAISLGIVEEHGGQLRVEPSDGQGVRAVLTLPAHPVPTCDSDPLQEAPP
jgi:signal transduction histidine kinase